MSAIAVPRTPTPDSLLPRSSNSLQPSPDRLKTGPAASRMNSGALTPPPSMQYSRAAIMSGQAKLASRRENSLPSPPATLKTGPPITSDGLYGEVPTVESVQGMNEEQLRRLVLELLPALGEARVTAAHSKLQHSLLAIENEEAAKRAEVEHAATRREVQVLQEGSPIQHGQGPAGSPQASMQRSLHLALSHCRELQHENLHLNRRLKSSKKLIADLDGRNAELKDHIQLLRQRIKDNRDHLNEMQASGLISISGTPINELGTPSVRDTPRTPATSRPTHEVGNQTISSQDPFDALLFAGQVLNGQTASISSTPDQPTSRKIHMNHMRGAHSLSSLPPTPVSSRLAIFDQYPSTPTDRTGVHRMSFPTPSTKLFTKEDSQAREDRDSTISVSEDEHDYRDEEIAGSQASQMATSMLRHSIPSANHHRSSSHDNKSIVCQTSASDHLTQSKLYGFVSKPGGGKMVQSLKRGYDLDENERVTKKAKLAHPGVGLGIKSWPSPVPGSA